jgi:hypothetical protein
MVIQTKPMREIATWTMREPVNAKFRISGLPSNERRAWNNAGTMFQLSFFSSTVYLKQAAVYELARNAASTYGLRDGSEPSKAQIAEVCSCR